MKKTTITPEDYVSYDLALALKKAGFDWPCIAQWACEPDGKPMLVGSTAFVFNNAELKGRDVSAPFMWQAQKWLRNTHKIDLNVDLDDETEDPYTVEIYKNKKCVVGHWKFGFFATYEQALSAGIASALELIEKKGE